MRGRNAEWAERAVREGVSLSAEEALAQKVIDLTARDVPELLSKLDGRKVTTAGGERTLTTAGATLATEEPDWRTRFLAIITDPSVALILLMIGVYGLFFEFWNPGLALPGVVGAVCLLVGLFALQMLPVIAKQKLESPHRDEWSEAELSGAGDVHSRCCSLTIARNK